jgi:hypothetical protein
MLPHLRRNAVAYAALFVALGGTGAYAAATITGAQVVDNSLTSKDVVGLTGKDIVESRLGQVRSSTALNGVNWKFYPTTTCGKRPEAGETTVLCNPGVTEVTNLNYQSSGGDGPIAELGPDLDLNGFCDGGPTSTFSDDIRILVTSAAPRISIHAEWTADGDGERPFGGLNNKTCLFSGMAIRTTPSKIGPP